MRAIVCHIIAVTTICILLLSSCKSDDSTYPPVQLEFVTAQTNDNGKLATITTDSNNSYTVSSDKSNNVFAADSTLRIVANYAFDVVEKDTTVCIYASAKAISTLPQTADKFKEIITDPAQVLSIWLGRNYLNIVLNVLAQSKTHKFAFIEEAVTTDAEGRKNISILLYHDNNGDLEAYTKRAYISIPLSQYTSTDNKDIIINFSLYTDSSTLKRYTFKYSQQSTTFQSSRNNLKFT
jgi:hypothetical protein